MKSLILATLLVALISSQVIAQEKENAPKETIYGHVNYDGFYNVSKGAMWAKRPEAKKVYNDETPEGVEVITFEADHYVRFAKGENNPLDINIIVFPKGQKIYKKDGEYFAAICGNKISFYKPVDWVIIRETIQIVSNSKIAESEKTGDHNVVDYGKPKPNLGNLNPNKNKEKKGEIKITVGGVVITIGVIAVLVKVATMIFHKKDSGSPGGAPITKPVVIPPPPVVTPPGGPGGAPLTK